MSAASLEGRFDDATAGYYFEVLPLHPKPEYLESLTSYLARLAELNGISTMDGLSAVCFPLQDRRITRGIADFPPLSLAHFSRVSVCTEEILRATTFFHLAAKFGRSTLPQPLSRFLTGCLSKYLRFCPICLAEQCPPHYPLTWRFIVLSCCTKHHCRLEERCGCCGSFQPLFSSPFKLGHCQACRSSLKDGPIAYISKEEHREALARLQEIEFLLVPQSWEVIMSSAPVKLLGQRLAYVRQKRRISSLEVSQHIGVTLTVVEGIERGNVRGKGANFQSYMKYADHFRLSLKVILNDIINHRPLSLYLYPLCPNCQQSHAVTKDGYNRKGLQRYQCQHCFHRFTDVCTY